MPHAPPRTPRYAPPSACALSSMTSRSCLRASSINLSICTSRPFRWTGMIAFVRGVIAASIRCTLMLWSSPTSTSTGVATTWWMTAIVAMHVCDTVMTSSPGPMPTASSSRRRPSVQLLTPTASAVPTNAARLCSKSSICPRMIRSPFESTSRIVVMTSSSMRRNSLPGSQNLTDTPIAPCDDLLDGFQDRFLVEAVHRLEVILIADDLVELRAQADALQRGVSRFELGHQLGDGAAQSALDAVLLQREDVARLRRRGDHRIAVDRLHRVHADQPHAESLAGEALRDLVRGREHAARGDERDVRSVADRDRAAHLEVGFLGVDDGLTRLAEAQVARSFERDHRARRETRLHGVSRRDHGHVGQRAHDRNVLGCVMRHTEIAVGETASNRNDLDVRPVVADVVANLFEAAQRAEVADRVGEDDLAGKGHARREADHVLLRHARVDELVGMLVRELFDHREAEVADHQAHAVVLRGEIVQRLDERGPHEASTSARAVTSSSGVGGL